MALRIPDHVEIMRGSCTNRRWRLWKWAGLTLTLLAAACLAQLLIGPRLALKSCKARLKSAGARLTIQECAIPVVAEHRVAAQRFMTAAQALSSGGGLSPAFSPSAMRMVAPGKARVGWQQPDLRTQDPVSARLSQRYGVQMPSPKPEAPAPTWDDLSDELSARATSLDEIRQASRVGTFDWAIDYSQGFETALPHLAPCKAAVQKLLSATLLALHEGRFDDALDLLETQLRIVGSLPGDGLLIDQLVRIALGAIALNTTWEALQAKGWTEDQLLRLQTAWQNVEFVEGMAHALEMERAVMIREYERCRQSPSRLAMLTGGPGSATGSGNPPDSLLGILTEWLRSVTPSPGGIVPQRLWVWFRSWDDERCTIEVIQKMIAAANDRLRAARSPRAFPLPLPAGVPFLPGSVLPPEVTLNRHLIASGVLGPLDLSMTKAFSAQVLRELAVAAIALHRYQGREGTFPQSLNQLVPQFLADIPLDWFDGRPLRYRQLGRDRFLLYSVNKDTVDDGGDARPAPNVSASTFSPHLARDFVWPEAAGGEPQPDGDPGAVK